MDSWWEVLEELRLSLDPRTFDTLLATSRLVELAEDHAVVQVSELARDALAARLQPRVDEVALRRLGMPVRFVAAGNGTKPAPAVADVSPAEPVVFEPPAYDTHVAGWFPVSEYESRFWAPLLGRVGWRLWEIVRKADTRKRKTEWTPARRWTAPSLAEQVPCGRQAVVGVVRKCTRETDGAYQDEHGIWRVQQVGGLETLVIEGIGTVERIGATSRITYRISVMTKLPLLNPDQVIRLAARLQVQHDRWLTEQGFNPEEWDSMQKHRLTDAKASNQQHSPNPGGVFSCRCEWCFCTQIHTPTGAPGGQVHQSFDANASVD